MNFTSCGDIGAKIGRFLNGQFMHLVVIICASYMSKFNAGAWLLFHKYREMELLKSWHMTNDSPAHEAVFLVFERDMIIGSDLVQALESHNGAARVIHLDDTENAPVALRGVSNVTAAFLELRPSEYEMHPVSELLEKHNPKLVFTIGEDEKQLAQSRGWDMLTRPFDDAMIQQSLSRI